MYDVFLLKYERPVRETSKIDDKRSLVITNDRFLNEKRSEILKPLTGDLILDDIPVGSMWSEYMQECREL